MLTTEKRSALRHRARFEGFPNLSKYLFKFVLSTAESRLVARRSIRALTSEVESRRPRLNT